MKGYPKWFTANFISLVLGILFFSGMLLVPTTFELRLGFEVPWRLAADHRIATAALHTFFSLITLLIVGALFSLHMRQEWRRGNSRFSGVSLAIIICLLAITGVGIFYFGNEQLSMISSLIHLAIGVLLFFLYLAHLYFAILRKSKSETDF